MRDARGVCYRVRTTCHIRPYIIVLIYGRGCESLSMHFIIWRSTKYRQHIQNPLIIDSTQVKNVYGVDVVDNTPTEVETLQKCLYWQIPELFPLPCHSSEEIATIAKPYDIRWMKPAEKLLGPYRHTEVYMRIRAMIAQRVEVFVGITAWMQLYHKEGLFRCETV